MSGFSNNVSNQAEILILAVFVYLLQYTKIPNFTARDILILEVSLGGLVRGYWTN